jgi:hypothetical protein
MKKLTKFEQGWIVCLATTVNGHGINTGQMESYRMIGSPTPEQCLASGLTESDAEAMRQLLEYCN